MKTLITKDGRELISIEKAGLYLLKKDGRTVQRTNDKETARKWYKLISIDMPITVYSFDDKTWK